LELSFPAYIDSLLKSRLMTNAFNLKNEIGFKLGLQEGVLFSGAAGGAKV
jgi:hypothetical protein